MTDNNDQLATLGQQVIDSLLATYNPEGDPELALAILPGQVLLRAGPERPGQPVAGLAVAARPVRRPDAPAAR